MLWWSAVVLHIRDQRMGPAGTIDRARGWSCDYRVGAGLVGAGLARDGITAVGQMHRVACIASKPAPTEECGAGVVGAGLARDGVTAVGQMHRVACIASKPAPTGECGAGAMQALLWGKWLSRAQPQVDLRGR